MDLIDQLDLQISRLIEDLQAVRDELRMSKAKGQLNLNAVAHRMPILHKARAIQDLEKQLIVNHEVAEQRKKWLRIRM